MTPYVPGLGWLGYNANVLYRHWQDHCISLHQPLAAVCGHCLTSPPWLALTVCPGGNRQVTSLTALSTTHLMWISINLSKHLLYICGQEPLRRQCMYGSVTQKDLWSNRGETQGCAHHLTRKQWESERWVVHTASKWWENKGFQELDNQDCSSRNVDAFVCVSWLKCELLITGREWDTSQHWAVHPPGKPIKSWSKQASGSVLILLLCV